METFSTLLSTAALAAIALAAWLLPKYLVRRVEEAARGAVDISVGKKLAEHGHLLSQQIETLRHSLATERERQSQDYALFVGRRNRIYAKIFSLFEKVRGHYSFHFAAFRNYRDYSRSPEADLRNIAASLQVVTDDERRTFVEQLDRGELEAARQTANTLVERDSLRRANREFVDFKNACIVHRLYLSPAVEAVIEEAARALALFSIHAESMIEEGRRPPAYREEFKDRSDEIDAMDGISARMREIMRAEIQGSIQTTALISPVMTVVGAPSGRSGGLAARL